MKNLYDKLVRGDRLSPENRGRVLAAYGYRWTVENLRRAKNWFHGPERYPLMDPITDQEWLRTHAWAVNADGSLDGRQRHALPGSMAQPRNQTAEIMRDTQLPGPRHAD